VPPVKSRIDGEGLKDVGPSFSSTASLVDEDSGAVYHGGGCAKLSGSKYAGRVSMVLGGRHPESSLGYRIK